MNGGLPMQEGGQLLASSNMLVNKRTLITARSGDLGLPNDDVNTSVYGLFGGQGTSKVYVSELGEHCEINYHHPRPADDRGTVPCVRLPPSDDWFVSPGHFPCTVLKQ